MIRSFIAIEISDKTKHKLNDIIVKLDGAKADVKWVSTKNLHITLKFLGDITNDAIVEISNIIRESCSDIDPFSLDIEGIDAFPNIKRPKVIFVNIKNGSEYLSKVYYRLNEKLSYLGIKKESRSYIPHLTIGRVRSQKNLNKLIDSIKVMDDDFIGNEQVGSIILMMSELLSKGPKYSRLDTIKFKKRKKNG